MNPDLVAGPGPDAARPPRRPGLLAALGRTTFRSLRHRNYRLYFLGQLVSFTGTWMQSAALIWFMFDRTGDPRWPSWVLAAQIGPTLLLGPWGGHLADRLPRRRLVLAAQAAFLANAVLLTLLVTTGHAAPAAVLALQLAAGVAHAVDLPARLALVPDLVPREDLVNAVGLNALLFNAARAVGPAVAAGVFLAAGSLAPALPGDDRPVAVGAALCFGLNALSYLVVLLALRGIRVEARPSAAGPVPPRSALDGVRQLWGRPGLAGLVASTLVVCVCGWPVLAILPAYTRLALGLAEQSYSLLVSALGGGALLAAVTTATFGTAGRHRALLVLGAASAAAGLAGLSQAGTRPVAAGCCACVGFGLVLFLSTGQSALQLAVPEAVRGRVMAVWAMTLSTTPLGHLAAGEAAVAFGVRPVLLAMAAGIALVAAGLAVARRWLRTPRPE